MQLTKFLLAASKDDGSDIVIDIMQITTYSPIEKDGTPLVHITMSDGRDFMIRASMHQMKAVVGKVGVPLYHLSHITTI